MTLGDFLCIPTPYTGQLNPLFHTFAEFRLIVNRIVAQQSTDWLAANAQFSPNEITTWPFFILRRIILPLIDREKLRYGTLPLFYWKTWFVRCMHCVHYDTPPDILLSLYRCCYPCISGKPLRTLDDTEKLRFILKQHESRGLMAQLFLLQLWMVILLINSAKYFNW